jgi:hypothetical protein
MAVTDLGDFSSMELHMVPHGDPPTAEPAPAAEPDPFVGRIRRARRPALRAVPDEGGRAWLLDPVALHAEWDELFAGLVDDSGLVPFRERVAGIWENGDPAVQEYLSGLRVHTPDEWEHGFEERHLGEWYRVLISAYISPVRGFVSPAALKDDLPDLGWVPSEARRLTWGRELAELALEYASEEAGTALELVMRVGNKGWLGPYDVEDYLNHFRSMDKRMFRDAPDLIPLVEDAFEVLMIAASAPDHVLLLPGA